MNAHDIATAVIVFAVFIAAVVVMTLGIRKNSKPMFFGGAFVGIFLFIFGALASVGDARA